VFFTFPAHPISPYRPAAREQNTDIMIALAHAAATFSSRGYEVYLDGIFGPWFLPVIAAELRSTGIPVDYVVLRAPLEIALRRVQTREGQGKDHIVRQMHAAFSELGPFSGHAVETADRAPEEVVSEIVRRRHLGVFALDLGRVASTIERP
jgi:hypothetical protein